MIEALRSLRLEITSLATALAAEPRIVIKNANLLERAEQLFLTWSTGVRPSLMALGVPREVLARSDTIFEKLARLTTRRSRKRDYLTVLTGIKHVLTNQVLLEVARIPAAPKEPAGVSVGNILIPEIPDLTNGLLPNALLGWTANLRGFLKDHSFDRNVFLMFAYRARHKSLVGAIRAALQELELNPIIAREHALTDDLYNPVACLLCCNYGIAIFDRAESGQAHNPNIIYELGMMHLLKRPCVILKHRDLKVMPSDLLQKLYESYRNKNEAVERIHEWWTRITAR